MCACRRNSAVEVAVRVRLLHRLRMRLARLLALLLAAALCLGGLLGDRAVADELAIETRDGQRRAVVLPAPQRAAPTVIVLHGAATTANLTASWSGFAEAAAGHGFAAVFPQGLFTVWNDGRRDGIAKADDVGFLRTLVGRLIERGVADPRRIYLAGISNGGMLTLRMLCEHPELFAGAGTVVASMPALVGATCRLDKPMPVVMLNGTADPVVPYKGGTVGMTGNYGEVWSVERTAAFLAWGNGCTRHAERALGGSDRAAIRVTRLDWGPCRSGQPVVLYRVEGGGHQVFGATNIVPLILGPGTSQVSAPEVILAEFAKG
jgi:polyhydroxybutyrate depolymerase